MKSEVTALNDKTRLELELNDDGSVTFYIGESRATYSVDFLDVLISFLGEARAAHAQEISRELPSAFSPVVMFPIESPDYCLHRNAFVDGLLLSLRHPGFGWLAFHMQRRQANLLRDDLARSLLHHPKEIGHA
ncbi:hypothetical protein QLQ15_13275 [Lysobacter sp. LF1]|uniref:Uncharacterized protein n=1 Tax=Lysobacter stagni TaxID=3045172 RepID=A0ABT6XI93_9GAMM|nr:hypothetical protein [Lysobacter sp. LF1]MDI9239877.1 hypothetical protein [Lysobacter sp. LF1]